MIPHSAIRAALRKLWMWQTTGKVRSRARISRGLYRCESCTKMVSKVEVDHTVSIGPTPGSRNAGADCTWDGFITRLFCSHEALQVICHDCHQQRTHGKASA